VPYYSGCIVPWQNVEGVAQTFSSECDEALANYFSCLAELSCEELAEGEYYSCYEHLDEEVLLECSTALTRWSRRRVPRAPSRAEHRNARSP
jgi:hypothetical protein